MLRKIVSVLLLFALCLQTTAPAFAHPRQEHDPDLELVLFGRRNYKVGQPAKIRTAIEAIECAAYLCPDQFNGKGVKELNTLIAYGVPGIPKSVDEIDFKDSWRHRRYTHMGWVPAEYPDKGNWGMRKEILLATVNKVFDFGPFTDPILFGWKVDYTDQCNSFCALVYYVHIVGDNMSFEGYEQYRKEGAYVIPLGRPHPGENNPDIIWELTEKYLPKLFSDPIKQTSDYKTMIRKLAKLGTDVRALTSSTGGINSEERFNTYKDYCSDFFNIMSTYMPELLIQEPFFKKVFAYQ